MKRILTRSAVAGLSLTFAIIFLGQVFVRPGLPSRASKMLDYPLMPGVALMNAVGHGRPHDPDFWVFAMLGNSVLYSIGFLFLFALLDWRKGGKRR